jgi:menaquinone-dependent protoporphyrinogen oxidase
MKILVGYASAHGSTAEVAGRIAAVLERHGLAVNVLPVPQVKGLAGYGGVVLGSAIHNQAWLQEALDFVNHHEAELKARPVWLFSVGMSAGLPRWIRGVARTEQSRRLAGALRDAVRPRGHLLLSGVASPGQFPRRAATLFRAAGGRFGDYRDWAEIEAWAKGIAGDLETAPRAFPSGR